MTDTPKPAYRSATLANADHGIAPPSGTGPMASADPFEPEVARLTHELAEARADLRTSRQTCDRLRVSLECAEDDMRGRDEALRVAVEALGTIRDAPEHYGPDHDEGYHACTTAAGQALDRVAAQAPRDVPESCGECDRHIGTGPRGARLCPRSYGYSDVNALVNASPPLRDPDCPLAKRTGA